VVTKINNYKYYRKKQQKLDYKSLTKYYKLIQNLQTLFTVELYRNINLSRFFQKQFGRSIAK